MKVLNLSFLELPILLIEILFLFALVLIVFSAVGYSFEYFAIGGTSLIIMFWRLLKYKNENHKSRRTTKR